MDMLSPSTDPAIYSEHTKWPKISLVTPVYNGGAFLEKCIQSIREQHYPNLEHLIIDGGSTDDTVEVIKRNEAHISYWVSEKDNGQSDAINKGLQRATGDIINWLNADDTLAQNALYHIGKTFMQPGVNLVTGITKIIDVNTDTIEDNRSVYFPESAEKTLSRPFLHQPSTYVSLPAIAQVGWLNEKLHYAMDIEWYIRFMMRFGIEGIRLLEKPIANFLVHETSKTGTSHHIFVKDIASLYYQIAVRNGFYDLAKKVDAISDNTILKDYELEFDFDQTSFDIEAILQNYIYKYIVIYFKEESMNLPRAKALASGFSGDKLLPEDQAILKMITDRLKVYPVTYVVKKFKRLLK